MDHPEERYYKLHRFFLSLSGLWPYQNAWNARLMRGAFTVIMLSSIFVQVSSIFKYKFDMDYIVEMMPAVLLPIGTLAHMYMRVLHIDKLRELLDCIWRDWASQKTPIEIEIMHKHAEITKLLSLFLSLQVYVIIIGYNLWTFTPEILDVISPLNESRPRIQPFKVEFFLEEKRYFYLIRSHACFVIALMPIVFIASSTLFMAVTQHACGMCELMGYRAENLFHVVKSATGCEFDCGTKKSGNTTVLIRLHYDIIKFIGVIETFHTIPFLLDFLGTLIVTTLTLTQVLTIAGNFDRAVRSIGFISTQMSYLFLCNYMGQRVTDKSSSICDKLYNSAWYDAIVLEQKTLLLIMKRRFQPLILTACKFYTMNLQNFEMLLQTTVSYCMFLRQI